MSIVTGGCYCGSVRFEASPIPGFVMNYHCRTCQRLNGSYAPLLLFPRATFRILSKEGLRVYKTSEDTERSFCGICGSRLFHDKKGSSMMIVYAGACDKLPTLPVKKNLFTNEAGHYYEMLNNESTQSPKYS